MKIKTNLNGFQIAFNSAKGDDFNLTVGESNFEFELEANELKTTLGQVIELGKLIAEYNRNEAGNNTKAQADYLTTILKQAQANNYALEDNSKEILKRLDAFIESVKESKEDEKLPEPPEEIEVKPTEEKSEDGEKHEYW